MSVDRVPLGELLALQRRQVWVEPDVSYTEIGLRSFGRGIFHKDPVTSQDLGAKRVFDICPGDLLVSNVFGWEGAVAVAGPGESGLIGSHRFMTWTPVDDAVDVRYAKHYLLSEAGIESLRRASPGSAGRNRTLNKSKFEAIRIPLPSTDEQRRITAHLDRCRAVATAVADGPLSLNAVEVVAGDREWGTPLSELIELDVDEFDVEDDAVYQRAGVLNAGRGLFSHGDLAGRDTKYRKLRRVRAGQVVLSRLTAFIGGVAYVRPDFDGFVLSQEYPTFSLRAGFLPEYVQSLMATAEVGRQLREASAGVGNTRQRVSAEAFLAINVPMLTAAEQQRVADLHRHLVHHDELVGRRATLAAALLPSARNEVFSALA